MDFWLFPNFKLDVYFPLMISFQFGQIANFLINRPLFRMTRLTPTWALDSFKTILHVNEPHPLSHEKCSPTTFILIGLKIAMQFLQIYLLFIQYSSLRIGFVIHFSNFRTISSNKSSHLSRNWGSISRVSQFWESYNRCCCWEALATYQLNFLVCWEASKTTITGAEK